MLESKSIDKGAGETSLIIEGSNIGDQRAKELASNISDSQITSIELSNNNIKIDDHGFYKLGYSLSCNQLTYISITHSNMGDDSVNLVFTLAKKYDANTQLAFLDLSDNGITAEGAKKLANGLFSKIRLLTSLKLRNNQIGDEGAKKLVCYASSNTQLAFLDLSHNKITAEGVRAILNTLRNNYYILGLNLEPYQAKADIYINRNKQIFIKNCNRILAGRNLNPEIMLRVCCQCIAILGFKNINSYGGIERQVIENLKNKLEAELLQIIEKLKSKLSARVLQSALPSTMPEPIISIIGQYRVDENRDEDINRMSIILKMHLRQSQDFLTKTTIAAVPLLFAMPLLHKYPIILLIAAVPSALALIQDHTSQLYQLYHSIQEGLGGWVSASKFNLGLALIASAILPMAYGLMGMYNMAATALISVPFICHTVFELEESAYKPLIIDKVYDGIYNIAKTAVGKLRENLNMASAVASISI